MVRDTRIKEFRFSNVISGTHTGSFVSDQSINGEILEVDWTYGSQGATGSLNLTNATTAEELWKRNAASGTDVQVARPRAFEETVTGGDPSTGSPVTPFIMHDHLVLNTGAILSGTTAVDVNVRYR